MKTVSTFFTVLAALAIQSFASVERTVFIDPRVKTALRIPDGEANTVLVFNEANFSMLGADFYKLTRGEKRVVVHRHLKSLARDEQQSVRAYLSSKGIGHQSFWIANVITVDHLTSTILKGLLRCCRHDLKSIVLSRGLNQVTPRLDKSSNSREAKKLNSGVQWNVEHVRADKCWSKGINGSGVVVATLDGGVRYTHDALVHTYRGNNNDGTFSHDYNWNDWAYKNPSPLDDDGHGTNVMGIAVGSKKSGVGVAPGATWISGKIFNYAGYSATAWTLGGAQWAMCPSPVNKPGLDENCTLGADVVSCSWGENDATEPYLKSTVRAWLKSGMVPVFAVGNSGPQCSTSVSPSDYQGVIGVGASDRNDNILGYSSRGPAKINGTKPGPLPYTALAPAIVAPGFDIQGPSYKSDEGYIGMSGTSQSAPHVAGAAALLLSAYPKLMPTEILHALFAGASRSTLQDPDTGSDNCGGVAWNKFPNYIYGWGRLDCFASLQIVNTLHHSA
jgi:subtilisin family serine protease